MDEPTMTESPTDWGAMAHKAAIEHLQACYEALDEEAVRPDVEWPDTAGPFCGCDDCVVREVLHAAWPIVVRAAAAGDLA
jgi:hypothetical protein